MAQHEGYRHLTDARRAGPNVPDEYRAAAGDGDRIVNLDLSACRGR